MKCICVGRNYAAHAAELGNSVPEEPLLFIKPAEALLREPVFRLPSFSSQIHFECELVVLLHSPLKNASSLEAKQAIKAVTLGIDFTARDLQDGLKAKGYPWEKAKAFDGSAYVSNHSEPYQELAPFEFSFRVNGEIRQQGSSSLMLTPIPNLLAYASRFFTLSSEDYVFTGTPAGVAAVSNGDVLEGFMGEKPFFEVRVQG